jgi:hypothetical protein
MLRLFVLLQITLLTAEHRVRSARSERGSVTVEHVLWAVAVIAIVAIVVAAVKAYVTSQSGKLK